MRYNIKYTVFVLFPFELNAKRNYKIITLFYCFPERPKFFGNWGCTYTSVRF